MNETQNSKYDLEERTLKFAEDIRKFIKELPKTLGNLEDIRQLIRSSGSIGANWIEANEAFSKKDFIMRTKICRKEAKESRYWLKLVDVRIDQGLLNERRQKLIKEVTELMKIFGSMIEKTKS